MSWDLTISVDAHSTDLPPVSLTVPLTTYLDSSFDLELEMRKLVAAAYGWKLD